MASKKSPGLAPLGHSPFGKEKLEGPKKHHDFHGSDASRPAMGSARAVPDKHWEMQYDLCAPSKNMRDTQGADFAAKRSDERKTTYLKVNREDH